MLVCSLTPRKLFILSGILFEAQIQCINIYFFQIYNKNLQYVWSDQSVLKNISVLMN